MKGIIYKLTNVINNKVYIGQTTQEFQKRMYQHKYSSKKHNTTLSLAIKKYGWDNFTKEILEEMEMNDIHLLKNKLNELEVYYISYFDSLVHHNGYNISKGGNFANYNEKKIVSYDLYGNKLMSFENKHEASDYYSISPRKIQKNCNGGIFLIPNANVIFRYEDDIFNIDEFNSRFYKNRIYMYGLDGKFINEFMTSVDASVYLKNEYKINATGSAISSAILNGIGTVYGFYFNKNKSFDIDIEHYRNRIPICAYNPVTKELFKEYKCMSDASKELCNGKRSGIASIFRSITGENKYPVYGYIWRYKEDLLDKYEYIPYRLIDTPVDQYDMVGNFIKSYNSVSDAIKYNNFNKTIAETIRKCINGECISCKNYIWRYKDHQFDEYNTINPKLVIINCYDKNNCFVRKFASGNDAARWLNVEDKTIKSVGGTIRNCCTNYHGCKTVYGYRFYYASDPNQPDKSKIIPNPNTTISTSSTKETS